MISSYRFDAGLRGIVQGIGCVRERLADELIAQGVQRPMIVCGAFVKESPAFDIVYDAVEQAIGESPLVFAKSRPHSPSDAIEEGARIADTDRVDAIVAVGGSSAIDSAKGIAVLLATGTDRVSGLTPAAPGALSAPNLAAAGNSSIPLFTATTTLSYAEFYPFWGTRRSDTGAKAGYGDHGVVSRTVFLDGEIAASTPDNVWFETAIKSFDDALLLYLRSGGNEPFLDPLLTSGMRGVLDHLPSSLMGAAAERQHVLTAMALTKYGAPRLQPGFQSDWFARAVRYALGSRYDLPHGVGTCIALTQGLRLHRATTEARQASLVDALGLRSDATDRREPIDVLVDTFGALLDTLGLPRSLDEFDLSDRQVDIVIDDITRSMPGLGDRATISDAIAMLRTRPGQVSSRK